MQDEMRVDHTKFGKVGKEHNILSNTVRQYHEWKAESTNFHPDLCQLFHDIFLALQIPEFLVKLQYTSQSSCLLQRISIPYNGNYV